VKADSLIPGPVTLREATATLRILEARDRDHGTSNADLLDGRMHGSGTLRTVGTDQGSPPIRWRASFEKLSPADVGQLLGLRWSGGAFDADGKIELSGFTDKELAASVKGTFALRVAHGRVEASATEADVPAALARFDRWSGDAGIGDGTITLQQNLVQEGARKRAVEAALTLGDPPRSALHRPGKRRPSAETASLYNDAMDSSIASSR